VRRLLSRPDEGTTVTDAATRLNFFHFGHFSGHYRNLFGETPSQTLRQARSHLSAEKNSVRQPGRRWTCAAGEDRR
jgi:AraC-like DNA-binding protein